MNSKNSFEGKVIISTEEYQDLLAAKIALDKLKMFISKNEERKTDYNQYVEDISGKLV